MQSYPAAGETVAQNRKGTRAEGLPVAIGFNSVTVVRFLIISAVVLIALHVVGRIAELYLSDFLGRDLLVSLFDLGGEANLPSVFSGIVLWIAASLLCLIGWVRRNQDDRSSRVWLAMGGLFIYLGFDELAQLHDRTVPFLRRLVGSDMTSGGLHYTWVLVYGPLVLIMLLATLKFLRSMDARTRNGMILAGAIYCLGALGLEIVEGFVNTSDGFDSPLMVAFITIEESMEIFGIILFVATLFRYILTQLPGLKLHFALKVKTETADADVRP